MDSSIDIYDSSFNHSSPSRFLCYFTSLFLFLSFLFFFSFYFSNFRSLFRATTFTVLLLNDIHYDPLYVSTATPYSACRSPVPSPNGSYIFGQYGCDSPSILISSVLRQAQKVSPHPDYIFISGDFSPHFADPQPPELLELFQTVFSMVQTIFPKVPIYATVGNHDFYPPWGSVETDPGDFENFAHAQTWLSPSELETFRVGGYFFHDFGSLRILFLNSVMYSVERIRTGDPDPFGQFAWIEKVGSEAIESGLSIGTVLHIPSAVQKLKEGPGWYPEYQERYHNLTIKYNFQFALNAHSHLDQFLPTKLESSARYFLSSPSVSPILGNNPGFRIYQIGDRGIENYQQYFGDLLKNPKGDLPWKLEYDFKTAYGVNDGSPENIAKAAEFARDDVIGKWEYHGRLYNQAIENGGFYYCVLTCLTADEIFECRKKLAMDVPFN
jgi:hypothetical protein